MLTWTNIRSNQILIWGFSIAFGSLVSICIDYVLSYCDPSILPFFYPIFIGVSLGSFFSGIASMKKGWLIGVIISFIHIIYLVYILSCPRPYLTDESIIIDWLSVMPTGIYLLATGLIGGYLGGVLYQKIILKRTIQGR